VSDAGEGVWIRGTKDEDNAMSRRKVNDAWTEYETPWVEEVPGEPFRYRVQSMTNPELWHMVDLADRGGHGACDCEFFLFEAAPNFRRHRQWIPYAPKRVGCSECKHIRAAWDYWHLNVAVPMMSRFRHGIPESDPTENAEPSCGDGGKE
jgi:hypothetical protein